MRVLVLGGGGREHALAWKISQSPLCEALYAAPGNPGIASLGTCFSLDIEDGAAVVAAARAHGIDFVVVGPEAPLAAGVVDALEAAGIAAFGPSAAAARLEASKAFTHEVCAAAGAPMAPWARFSDVDAAKAHIRASGAPIVVKADGLAAGKGVVVAETVAEAERAVEAMLGGAFGAAGAEVIVEGFLAGEEASFFALSDGETVLALGSAQDHKRAFDGDKGPNTGGMGAYAPAPVMTPAREGEAMERIVRPAIAEMARRGTPYRGVLYAGLMIGENGPTLIEFNARFGDPECQVLMPRLGGDVLALLHRASTGRLAGSEVVWREGAALGVVLAAEGYPGAYRKGSEIRGVETAEALEGVTVFQAGTARAGGALTASGGRVLTLVGEGRDIAEAQARAYCGVAAIEWPEGRYRRDIGWRAIGR